MRPFEQVQPLPTPMKLRVAQALTRLALFSLLLFGSGLFLYEKLPTFAFLDRLPFLRIEEVQIHSEWPLTPSTVRGWLPPLEGKNILSVRPDALIALLEQKPWVESVTLKKEYPNRITLDIDTKRAEAVTLLHGVPFFLDAHGRLIERASPALLRALDLPIISVDKNVKEGDAAAWPIASAMQVLDRFRIALDARYTLSQITLDTFPYFRIFLSDPKEEILFSWENWEVQLPILALLLHSPPNQIGQPQRINLVFPKKAIVSHPAGY